MFKRGVLLAIHNFSEMKSFANNTKIRSSLKFPLIRYNETVHMVPLLQSVSGISTLYTKEF